MHRLADGLSACASSCAKGA